MLTALFSRLFFRRQLLFLFVMLPMIPFGSRSLICRSDPIIYLSNGLTLIIGASIDGTLENIEEVHYDVHVPAGVTLISYESTPLWEKTQETFNLISDQPTNRYSVTVMVKLNSGIKDYVADGSLITADGITYGPYTQNGKSGKPFTVAFSGPSAPGDAPNGQPPAPPPPAPKKK